MRSYDMRGTGASEDKWMVAPKQWVIDNMVWTDSWPSIAGVDEEKTRKVLAEKWRDK
jgi:hypothetical protein